MGRRGILRLIETASGFATVQAEKPALAGRNLL
jgi:hypothetical protein